MFRRRTHWRGDGGAERQARPAAVPEARPTPAAAIAEARSRYYMAAADLHLKRMIALADTEWKVSLAFWAVLLASGLSFIRFTDVSTPPMIVYIAHSDYLFLVPYLMTAYVFVFGFSVNQAESIVYERTRYRHCQNLAAQAVGAEQVVTADLHAPIEIKTGNRVWAYKLLSTFLFVTGIWGASQWLAHGKISTSAGVAAVSRPVWCAFLNCSAPNAGVSADGVLWCEWGTLIWIVSAAFTLRHFLRARLGTT